MANLVWRNYWMSPKNNIWSRGKPTESFYRKKRTQFNIYF